MEDIKKTEVMCQTPQKNNNHHHLRDSHHLNGDSHHLRETQLDLFNQPIIKRTRIPISRLRFLEMFEENEPLAITRKHLEVGSNLHPNTIDRFIKKALNSNWIQRLNPIQGETVYNALWEVKLPDKLSTGQIANDKRFNYYKLTEDGKAYLKKIKC